MAYIRFDDTPIEECVEITGGTVKYLIPWMLWKDLLGPKPESSVVTLPGGIEIPSYLIPNDGCTAVPDVFLGIKQWVACLLHDFHEVSGMAELWFHRNLYIVARYQKKGRLKSLFASTLYSGGVRILGRLRNLLWGQTWLVALLAAIGFTGFLFVVYKGIQSLL